MQKATDIERGLRESEDRQPLLAECPPTVRAGFIKRVYALLALQLLATAGVSLVFSEVANVRSFIVSSPELMWVSAVLSLLTICPLYSYKSSHPLNMILLALFTLFEATTVGVLVAIYCEAGLGAVVILATACTFGLFAALSVYVHVSQRDFTFLGGFLMVGLGVLLVVGIVSVLLPSLALQAFVAGGGIVVFSGLVLYDTSEMIKYMGPDDTVVAVVQLYLDVINLFLYILQLLNSCNGGHD